LTLRRALTTVDLATVSPGTDYVRVRGANACGAGIASAELVIDVPQVCVRSSGLNAIASAWMQSRV
jgi:hypothetical protein